MIHFSRKTEYALLAIEHMARHVGVEETAVSTREISDTCRIPYPLLAKILQKLAAKGIARSVHGTKGGYMLTRSPSEISVAEVVEVFDGPIAVAECLKDEKTDCPQWDGCHIKDPFLQLNGKIHDLLVRTKIADLTQKPERRYAIEPTPGH